MPTFIPQGKRIFVRLRKVEEFVTKSGLIVPDMHHEESRIGEIISVGPEVTMYHPGQLVVTTYYAGIALHLPAFGILDDTHRIIEEDSVQCIFSPD